MLSKRPVLVEIATAAVLIAAPFVLPHLNAAPNTVNRILVWGLFGIGFDILFGYTGLLSFGQSAFYGTGGFIASSNDAMAAVANSLGTSSLQEINTTAARLGLSHMVFYDPTGLDISTTSAGAYGSAWDVARLATIFYNSHPEFFELTQGADVSVEVAGHVMQGHATAAPLLSIPGLVGAKTGFTDLAGGNLVAIFDLDIGHPLVAAVLGSTQDGRFDDIRTIIEAARTQL